MRHANLEHWYQLAAKIVSLYGRQYLPVFERLNAEVKEARRNCILFDIAQFVSSASVLTDSKD